ncbi:MAG: FliM/FliN family flagellar motor switch protein [Porticoccaceae bacterium]|nr:FliM/FliN family flagellar motor switch protein [Pseudomonadales bacterium]MCP5173033.1 FliM/FliN family flagellar motor switch protein [Pseudomonadales bacterium]MCP5302507.1 FliM/FliN family flagellar motor switch protein [Pseudomonadales bacterium]
MATKDVLSEGELDALMDSVSGGDVPLEDIGDGRSCQPFDFSTREQALLAQMPALRTINEKHSQALEGGLYSLFKMTSEVAVADIKLRKISEVLAAIPEPSAINVVKIKPFNGSTLVVLPGELLSFFVDQYFGGAPGSNTAMAARENLTPTEKRISDVLLDKFMSTLVEAWKEKIVLSCELEAFEVNPEFLPPLPLGEMAMQFQFEIRVLEWKGAIDWVVPYSALEPLRGKLGDPAKKPSPRQSDKSWENYFRNELLGVDIEVSGLFASRQASLGDVLAFQMGSIVPLKPPSDVAVCIDGQPFSSGEYGVANGHKAIRIKEVFSSDSQP